jgi:hypothetical protein
MRGEAPLGLKTQRLHMKYILDDKYEINLTMLYASDPYEFFCMYLQCKGIGRGEGFDGGMQLDSYY